ncbi:hypothetical protein [Actinokineospora pegani]|uniref:hypothetical protein n=1 Tax=Actinokineospora pegani TaxID=2654637 RepID=UPI0012EA8079|nr:hypothetical protein [Actinokineospora pegani]
MGRIPVDRPRLALTLVLAALLTACGTSAHSGPHPEDDLLNALSDAIEAQDEQAALAQLCPGVTDTDDLRSVLSRRYVVGDFEVSEDNAILPISPEYDTRGGAIDLVVVVEHRDGAHCASSVALPR